MEAQDYPIAHFEGVARLARALKQLPAQVLEHEYSYESFGSWLLVVRHKGIVGRIVFDGHESDLGIQTSKDRKPPYRYGSLTEMERGLGADSLDDAMVEKICGVIVQWERLGSA